MAVAAALLFELPRTVPAPWPDPYATRRAPEYTGWHLSDRLPVAPRLHDRRISWRPARVECCLPWLRDEFELDEWLATASVWRGSIAAYHRGNLAADREHDPTLDLLARAILLRSSALVHRIAQCGHSRGRWVGSSDVIPFARRLAPGIRLYCVMRTTPPGGRGQHLAHVGPRPTMRFSTMVQIGAGR